MKTICPGDIIFVRKGTSLRLYYSYFICLYKTSHDRARYLSFLTNGECVLETFSISFNSETDIYETLRFKNKHD